MDGRIDGVQCHLVVDTGSNQTVLRADMVDGRDLPPVPGGLCDVTGKRSPLFGPTEVMLTVGAHTSLRSVYVSPSLEVPCILGLGFLTGSQLYAESGGDVNENPRFSGPTLPTDDQS